MPKVAQTSIFTACESDLLTFKLSETISGLNEILSGSLDAVNEAAFYLIGILDLRLSRLRLLILIR